MSETRPVPPKAERPAEPKRLSRGFWLALSVTILLAAGVFTVLVLLLSERTYHDGPRPYDGIRQMGTALKIYANDHDGHLPPTLRAMIPEYLPQTDFDTCRYKAQKTGEHLDWLYFPRERLDALSEDTILLASPSTLLNTAGAQLRIVTNAAGQLDYIPEADFQRLIREQNPPAASPSPAPAP